MLVSEGVLEDIAPWVLFWIRDTNTETIAQCDFPSELSGTKTMRFIQS